MEELKAYCKEMVEMYPQHLEEIMDLLQLTMDEIEGGESQPHEIELCYGSIEEVIG